MGDVIDGDLYQRIHDLAGFEAEKLGDAERAERAQQLLDISDTLSDGGDHPVEVAVIREVARGIGDGDSRRVEDGLTFVQHLYRHITDSADHWYELDYVYSQERIEDLEAETMRRLARHQASGEQPMGDEPASNGSPFGEPYRRPQGPPEGPSAKLHPPEDDAPSVPAESDASPFGEPYRKPQGPPEGPSASSDAPPDGGPEPFGKPFRKPEGPPEGPSASADAPPEGSFGDPIHRYHGPEARARAGRAVAEGAAAVTAGVAGLFLLLGGGGGATTTVGAVDVVIERRVAAVGTFQVGEITITSELVTEGTITDPKTGQIDGTTTEKLTIDRANGEDETETGSHRSTGLKIDPETGLLVCPCPEDVTRPAPPENADAARQVAAVGKEADGVPKRTTTEGEHEIGTVPDAPEPTTDLILTGMPDSARPRIIENSVSIETVADEKKTGGGSGTGRSIGGIALLGLGGLAGLAALRDALRRGRPRPPSGDQLTRLQSGRDAVREFRQGQKQLFEDNTSQGDWDYNFPVDEFDTLGQQLSDDGLPDAGRRVGRLRNLAQRIRAGLPDDPGDDPSDETFRDIDELWDELRQVEHDLDAQIERERLDRWSGIDEVVL